MTLPSQQACSQDFQRGGGVLFGGRVDLKPKGGGGVLIWGKSGPLYPPPDQSTCIVSCDRRHSETELENVAGRCPRIVLILIKNKKIALSLSLSLSLYIYIYIYIYVSMSLPLYLSRPFSRTLSISFILYLLPYSPASFIHSFIHSYLPFFPLFPPATYISCCRTCPDHV